MIKIWCWPCKETYEVVDELDDEFKYETDVSSYQNKEGIEKNIEGGFNDYNHNFGTNKINKNRELHNKISWIRSNGGKCKGKKSDIETN